MTALDTCAALVALGSLAAIAAQLSVRRGRRPLDPVAEAAGEKAGAVEVVEDPQRAA